jgi:hypothetical protein
MLWTHSPNMIQSDRDWIYWRQPTVATREAFSAERCEAQVRIDRGEVRIGMITAEVKLGESWCDASKVGRAIFLDTFFGVLHSGDKAVATGANLKAAVGDVIAVRLRESSAVFAINGSEVGQLPVDSRQELRMAVQARTSERQV